VRADGVQVRTSSGYHQEISKLPFADNHFRRPGGRFEDVVATVPEDFKVPWFNGKKNIILKVKSRWLKGNKKATVGGVGDISLKEYDFEGTKGYYVSGV
jgi:hypothetical protein